MEKERDVSIGIDFTQPSTWRGLAMLVSAVFGVVFSPEQLDTFITVGVAVSGAIGVFVKEPK